MLDDFKEHIQENHSYLFDSKILIAVSGGVDSVVLAHLCNNLKLDISIAHCNFKLRGEESDNEEHFVFRLAKRLGIEGYSKAFQTIEYARDNKISVQMAARELRYDWFESLCETHEFDYIFTAHHADDNLETFLINLGRGSGLEGLSGIPERSGNIIRPLLKFSRETILDYAKSANIEWMEDSSNAETKYLRNQLRHNVVPQLKETNPDFLGNVIRTIENLKDVQLIVQDKIDDLMSEGLIQDRENGMKIDIEVLKQTDHPKPYLYYLLNDFGFTEWDAIERLLDAQSGKQIFSQGWRLIKDRHLLLLSPIEESRELNIDVDVEDNEVDVPKGKIVFDEVDSLGKISPDIIYVDKDKLNFPLNIRKWRGGDKFHPFGLYGTKKLSKYFKDEKMSLLQKEATMLLCSEDEIVWVIGKRADDRFKVTESTRVILQIQWMPNAD